MKTLLTTTAMTVFAATAALAESDMDIEMDAEDVILQTDATVPGDMMGDADTDVASTSATKLDDELPMTETADAELTTPMGEDGFVPTELAALTAEDLEGVEVFGPEEENIGEVADLIITDDGTISEALVDVGGFLGFGEKRVALAIEDLVIMQDEDGDELRIYSDASQAQLEAMEEYQES
jgi:hypothetical protein